MSTSVVIAELLIVGLQSLIWIVCIILSIFGINWVTSDLLNILKDWMQLLTIFILGLAYTFGILIDRISDSLLGSVNKSIKKSYIDKSYPKVDHMRLYIKTQSPKLDDYLDYIRSRTRIVRSTTFNVAMLIISFTLLYILRLNNQMSFDIVLLIDLVLLILLTISIMVWFRISQTYYKRLKRAYKLVISNSKNDDKRLVGLLEHKESEQEAVGIGVLKTTKLKR